MDVGYSIFVLYLSFKNGLLGKDGSLSLVTIGIFAQQT